MQLYTVDSVRDGVVRLLLRGDETCMFEFPERELPDVQEGDIISAEIVDGSLIRFALEEAETANARSRIKEKLAELKKRLGD